MQGAPNAGHGITGFRIRGKEAGASCPHKTLDPEPHFCIPSSQEACIYRDPAPLLASKLPASKHFMPQGRASSAAEEHLHQGGQLLGQAVQAGLQVVQASQIGVGHSRGGV